MSPELNIMVQGCLKRIRRWRVPFNWSQADWWEEIAAQGQGAAWKALGDYDTSRGVLLSDFIQSRVMSRVLAYYRQEWAYGTRCVTPGEEWETEDPKEHTPGCNEDHESLHQALALLPAADRQLMEQLFWENCTETDIARWHHISQPAVSRRKRLILQRLHKQLSGGKKTLRARL